jgi:hypothetical protein
MVKSVLIFGFIIGMIMIGYDKVRGWFIRRKATKLYKEGKISEERWQRFSWNQK